MVSHMVFFYNKKVNNQALQYYINLFVLFILQQIKDLR